MPNVLTHRKWREAQYFCGKLAELDGHPNLARAEEYGFLASAFLAAARSVIDVACKENPLTFADAFANWKSSLSAENSATYAFVSETRRRTVHFGHAAGSTTVRPVPAAQVYSVAAAPWVFDEQATVDVSGYSITLSGVVVSACEVFSRYLQALSDLVAVFAEA